MGDYRKLQVWENSHQLAVQVFRMTAELPRSQRAEVADQLRRSALSVPANIVEGCGRSGDSDMLRHFRIALGSANELEYLLLFTRDSAMLPAETADPLIMDANMVRRMLAALINRLSPPTGQPQRPRAKVGSAAPGEPPGGEGPSPPST